MNLFHLGVGIAIGGLVIAAIIALELHTPPNAQRLSVKNEFADARCRIQFNSGAVETFSVRKGAEHRKTYKVPRPGFIFMHCRAANGIVEIPGSLHLRSDALAQITIRESGIAEFSFIWNKSSGPAREMTPIDSRPIFLRIGRS